MKCKVFDGPYRDTRDAFNQWVKGKALAKDVIIHTHIYPQSFQATGGLQLVIVVFYPEGDYWDKVKESPIEAMAAI